MSTLLAEMEQEKNFLQYRRRNDEINRNNGRRDAQYENNGQRPNNSYNNNHYYRSPVSYTHLDVYKRQVYDMGDQEKPTSEKIFMDISNRDYRPL